jgi:hypothetical protein
VIRFDPSDLLSPGPVSPSNTEVPSVITRTLLLAAAMLVAGAVPAAAQSAYARTSDTLRFREVTTMDMKMTTPQGEVPVSMEHDATIAVLLLPGDSARAWYETLRVGLTSPAGAQYPETGSVLKQPFRLKLDPRGRTELVSSPSFPESFQGISDLTYQFSDFFLRLPSTPLKVGLAWTDTLTRKTNTAEKTATINSIASYRVERDTVVAGEPAFVISMRQQLSSESEGPVPGQPVRARATTTGSDEGVVIFSRKGRMLSRQRTGTLSGGTTLTVEGGSMEIGQAVTFRNTIEVVK